MSHGPVVGFLCRDTYDWEFLPVQRIPATAMAVAAPPTISSHDMHNSTSWILLHWLVGWGWLAMLLFYLMAWTKPNIRVEYPGYEIKKNINLKHCWPHRRYIIIIPKSLIVCTHIGSCNHRLTVKVVMITTWRYTTITILNHLWQLLTVSHDSPVADGSFGLLSVAKNTLNFHIYV